MSFIPSLIEAEYARWKPDIRLSYRLLHQKLITYTLGNVRITGQFHGRLEANLKMVPLWHVGWHRTITSDQHGSGKCVHVFRITREFGEAEWCVCSLCNDEVCDGGMNIVRYEWWGVCGEVCVVRRVRWGKWIYNVYTLVRWIKLNDN